MNQRLKTMALFEKLGRFSRKPLSEKWAAIQATVRATATAAERRHVRRILSGAHAPPRVLRSKRKTYVAYRPDSDAELKQHSEFFHLSEKWVSNNLNNRGDLPRFYSLALNIKQIIEDGIVGDFAELGVYRGNSAALLAHYARMHCRSLILFDTFEGFDPRDLVGVDGSKQTEFADTSLGNVRGLVGDEGVRFIRGRFPDSVPEDLFSSRFCLAHIDCDLYEPAKAGLEYFYPRLSPGGLLIVHDYANPWWSGIKAAVDEYCRDIGERPVVFGDKSGTAMIRKCALIG